MWLAVNDDWLLNEQGQPVDYHVCTIREFRYQGGQRYFTRLWHTDPEHPELQHDPTTWTPDTSAMWTEYVGGQPYTDFEAHLVGDDPVATDQARFLAGDGIHAQQTLDGQTDPIRYLHGGLIDSTMMLTDDVGSPAETTAYTAFGDLITDYSQLTTRCQYAGGWGYESGLLSLNGANPELPPITLQHVGARWYEPGTGRFDQRDPIGVEGGLNVYAYVANAPTVAIDPDGDMTLIHVIIIVIAAGLAIWAAAKGCNGCDRLAGTPRNPGPLGPNSDEVGDWGRAGGPLGPDDMRHIAGCVKDVYENAPGQSTTGLPDTDAPGAISTLINQLISLVCGLFD